MGRSGTGNLTITDGADVISVEARIGQNVGANGTVTLTGANSSWEISNTIIIGTNSTGSLIIEDGAYISSSTATLGFNDVSNGTVTITDVNSAWDISGSLTIGRGIDSVAEVTIAEGAAVNVTSGDVFMATQAGSTATLNIGAAAGDAATSAGTLQANRIEFGEGTGSIIFNHTDANYVFATDLVGSGAV